MDLEKLKAPFDNVKTRQGPGGKMLSYLTARQVQDRLDDVCGPENWQNRFHEVKGVTICDIGILCGETWIWKSDGSDESDIEAEKGALSGAFKRAAVHFGVGRYLYGDDTKSSQNAPQAPPRANPNAPPTEKQVNFLLKLSESSSLSEEEKTALLDEIDKKPSRARISKLIDRTQELLKQRKSHEVDQGTPNPPPPAFEEVPPPGDELPFSRPGESPGDKPYDSNNQAAYFAIPQLWH